MRAVQPLQCGKNRAVTLGDHMVGYVDPEIWVHTNQMGVEGSMVQSGHADAVADGWRPTLRIRHDVGTYQKGSKGEATKGAPVPICCLGLTAEPGLMVAYAHQGERVGSITSLADRRRAAGFC